MLCYLVHVRVNNDGTRENEEYQHQSRVNLVRCSNTCHNVDHNEWGSKPTTLTLCVLRVFSLTPAMGSRKRPLTKGPEISPRNGSACHFLNTQLHWHMQIERDTDKGSSTPTTHEAINNAQRTLIYQNHHPSTSPTTNQHPPIGLLRQHSRRPRGIRRCPRTRQQRTPKRRPRGVVRLWSSGDGRTHAYFTQNLSHGFNTDRSPVCSWFLHLHAMSLCLSLVLFWRSHVDRFCPTLSGKSVFLRNHLSRLICFEALESLLASTIKYYMHTDTQRCAGNLQFYLLFWPYQPFQRCNSWSCNLAQRRWRYHTRMSPCHCCTLDLHMTW